MIITSAPTRLDFGGGWTDVPPYPEERGGFVCNLAIERRATVTLVPDQLAPAPSDPLMAAALRRAGVHGVRVTVDIDFPYGAGLGGSSSAGVALAAALAAYQGEHASAATLAERSRATEVDELKVAGGFQDHYAAAFGGALGITLGDTRSAECIPLSAATVAALESRITVVFTGESRISATTITAVLDAYRDRVPRVVEALDHMALLARAMRGALHAGDVSTLGELISEHWVLQRSLHDKISTPRIDALETAVRAVGATGFKALGASGGGCVLIVSQADQTAAVRAATARLGAVLDWRVATDGVRISS